MQTIAKSVITSKQQLTLPKPIRNMLGVVSGDCLIWQLDQHGHIIVTPGRSHSLEDIRSAVAEADQVESLDMSVSPEDMKAGITRHIRSKHASH